MSDLAQWILGALLVAIAIAVWVGVWRLGSLIGVVRQLRDTLGLRTIELHEDLQEIAGNTGMTEQDKLDEAEERQNLGGPGR